MPPQKSISLSPRISLPKFPFLYPQKSNQVRVIILGHKESDAEGGTEVGDDSNGSKTIDLLVATSFVSLFDLLDSTK